MMKIQANFYVMKKMLHFAATLLILSGWFSSCGKENTKEENISEIAIGSKNPVANYTIDGIKFNFCLLNESSKPATVFNEGENFSFYFKVTNNNTNEELAIDGSFIPWVRREDWGLFAMFS
jgi:hypothetical protein